MPAEATACRWCGDQHGKICPWVKALEFGAGGEVTRVEFLTAADMPRREEPAAPAQDYRKLGGGG